MLSFNSYTKVKRYRIGFYYNRIFVNNQCLFYMNTAIVSMPVLSSKKSLVTFVLVPGGGHGEWCYGPVKKYYKNYLLFQHK